MCQYNEQYIELQNSVCFLRFLKIMKFKEEYYKFVLEKHKPKFVFYEKPTTIYYFGVSKNNFGKVV